MDILYWHWWVLGLGLFVAEMLLPTGFMLLFVGAAAMLVGGLAYLFPGLGWQVEFTLFAVVALAAFFLSKRFRRPDLQTDQPSLNRRGDSYVGRTFTLVDPIVNGIGKLRVDDTQWRVSGADVPAGTQVRVVQADGATLMVERLP